MTVFFVWPNESLPAHDARGVEPWSSFPYFLPGRASIGPARHVRGTTPARLLALYSPQGSEVWVHLTRTFPRVQGVLSIPGRCQRRRKTAQGMATGRSVPIAAPPKPFKTAALSPSFIGACRALT